MAKQIETLTGETVPADQLIGCGVFHGGAFGTVVDVWTDTNMLVVMFGERRAFLTLEEVGAW